MKRSSAERSTRMRERAQQSWPALPNTASGARPPRPLEVGVGEHDVGRLAAELERHPLDRAPRRPRAIRRPTSVEPVKATLATSGCSTSRWPQTAARPGHHVHHALGQPRLERDPLQLERGQRRQLGRLQHHRVAGRQRRRHLPRRRSSAGSSRARSAPPRRAARGRSCPPRPRPGSCRRAAARARRRSSGRSRTTMPISPRASAIGLPALRASSAASSSRVRLERVGEAGAAGAARSAGATARQAGKARLARARPPRRSPRRPRARHLGHHLARWPARSPRSSTPPCRARRAPRSTSAAITRLRSSSSGCQSTPSANAPARHSIASTTSSSADQPVTTRPVAESRRRPGGGAT